MIVLIIRIKSLSDYYHQSSNRKKNEWLDLFVLDMWSLFSLLIVFLDKRIQYIYIEEEIIEIEKKEKKSFYTVWSLFIHNYIEKCRFNLFSNLLINKLSIRIYKKNIE